MCVACIIIVHARVLAWHTATEMAPKDHGTRLGRKESDRTSGKLELIGIIVKMEDRISRDYGDLHFQRGKRNQGRDWGRGCVVGGPFQPVRIGLFALVEHHVFHHELAFEAVSIAKNIVAYLDKALFDVQPVQVLGRCTVEGKLAQILSKATAQIEELLRVREWVVSTALLSVHAQTLVLSHASCDGLTESGKHVGIENMAAQAQVEPTGLPNAWIRIYGKRSGSLY